MRRRSSRLLLTGKPIKKIGLEKELRLKRKKDELVQAGFGSKRQISHWKDDKVHESYKKLEELRKKDPSVPQKPDYPATVVTYKRQPLITKKRTAPTAADYLSRKQKMADAERLAKEQEEKLIKIGVRQMLAEQLPSTTAQAVSSNKSLPRNPSDSKILKWKSDKQTHVLTLLRSDGEAMHITREDALGLKVEDLQDLLDLPLCREDDDSDSLIFELQFKGQVRDYLKRQ